MTSDPASRTRVISKPFLIATVLGIVAVGLGGIGFAVGFASNTHVEQVTQPETTDVEEDSPAVSAQELFPGSVGMPPSGAEAGTAEPDGADELAQPEHGNQDEPGGQPGPLTQPAPGRQPPAAIGMPSAEPTVCPVGAVGWAYESVEYVESETSVLRNLDIGNEYDVTASVRVFNSSNWAVRLNSLSVPIDYRTSRVRGSIPLGVGEITLSAGEERSFASGWRNAVGVSDTDSFDFNWAPARLTYPSMFSWVDPPADCYSGGPYPVTFVR